MKKFFIIITLLSGTAACSSALPGITGSWTMPIEKVVLLPYNPMWDYTYRKEAEKIASAIGGKRVKAIQHFGSTSIPGMIAKPIIDIIVGLDEYRLSKQELVSLQAAGYKFIEESHYCQRFYFHKRDNANVNISITSYDSPTWRDCLSVRDYLMEHQDEREAYMSVKIRALLEGNNSINLYSQYKSEFVKKLTDRARAWRSDE